MPEVTVLRLQSAFRPKMSAFYGASDMSEYRNVGMSKEEIAPRHIQAVIAAGSHLFPSRTEKLSPLAPMVLHTRGRVGSRHFKKENPQQSNLLGIPFYAATYSLTGPWAKRAFR